MAHNSYLAILVEQGIIGFAMYVAMFIAVFHQDHANAEDGATIRLVLLATLVVAMLPAGLGRS